MSFETLCEKLGGDLEVDSDLGLEICKVDMFGRYMRIQGNEIEIGGISDTVDNSGIIVSVDGVDVKQGCPTLIVESDGGFWVEKLIKYSNNKVKVSLRTGSLNKMW